MTPRKGRPGSRLLVAGALCAGATLLAFVTLLPPRAIVLRQPAWHPAGTAWRGAFHVHTNRSDGNGTIDEVAAAAARAGLQFVILSDHGDGTREPEPPSYRSGVLVVDGVEVGTAGGHYVAVGMARAPYPLGGEERDVVEDVARLGGFGVIAHPDSPKGAWHDWEAPAGAMEWLNADSQWRDEGALRLVRAALTYPFRPAETLASLLNQPGPLGRWDRAAASRRVVALAGADAHARIGLRPRAEPYQGRSLLAVPSYESSFRAFSLHLVTERPPTGRAEEDARGLVAALRAGRLHTVIDGWASPAMFEFAARGQGVEAVEGGELEISDPVVLRVRSNAPLYAATVLLRDGVEVHRVDRQSLVYATDRPGRYRVEVWLGRPGSRTPIPWIVSNAIVVRRSRGQGSGIVDQGTGIGERGSESGDQGTGPAGRRVSAGETGARRALGPLDWHVERHAGSTGEIDGRAGEATLRFRLGGGAPSGQFAALATPARLRASDLALIFRGRADRPMRVSLQLRGPSSVPDGLRWRRSVYLDPEAREIRIPLEEMTPVERNQPPAIPWSSVDNLLFVVDTVNTCPGSSGRFTVSDIRLESAVGQMP